MANAGFIKAIIEVQHLAKDGVKYSSLTKIQQAAADRLANRGKIGMTPISGDWIINTTER